MTCNYFQFYCTLKCYYRTLRTLCHDSIAMSWHFSTGSSLVASRSRSLDCRRAGSSHWWSLFRFFPLSFPEQISRTVKFAFARLLASQVCLWASFCFFGWVSWSQAACETLAPLCRVEFFWAKFSRIAAAFDVGVTLHVPSRQLTFLTLLRFQFILKFELVVLFSQRCRSLWLRSRFFLISSSQWDP